LKISREHNLSNNTLQMVNRLNLSITTPN